MRKLNLNRRSFLTNAATTVLVGSCLKVSPTLAAKLAATPPQVLGPFYPLALPTDTDFNLTLMVGKTSTADGEVIEITGQVVDRVLSD